MPLEHDTTSFKLPEPLKARLQHAAAVVGRSPADIVVQAVAELVDDIEDAAEAKRRLAAGEGSVSLEEVEAEFVRRAAE